MTDDLVKRLRLACSPESPLGKLFTEAADDVSRCREKHCCPIHMEHASQFCSAGYCFTCLEQRYGDAVERAEKAELERDANRNLAVANGQRALEEHNRADAAEASLKEAVELLKPFAELAGDFMDDDHMSSKADDRTVWGYNDNELTYGEFRAARRFLSARAGGADENH